MLYTVIVLVQGVSRGSSQYEIAIFLGYYLAEIEQGAHDIR